jgi:hypothetical protein
VAEPSRPEPGFPSFTIGVIICTQVVTKNREEGSMAESVEVVELELIPIPPDTIASAKEELVPLVEAALREVGREDLLSEKQIQIQIEKAFPTDQVIIVGLTLLSGIALETYKTLILPRLKERFEVKQKSKRGRKGSKNKK